jgi:hypothetical protein
LALSAGGAMQNYHIGTFTTQEECAAELSKAHVLVKSKGQSIDCIEIVIDETYIKLN